MAFHPTEIKLKVSIAAELKDSIDLFQGQGYPKFLEKLMPVFMQLLRGKPVFISTSAEQV
jgi:transformation/transcription domain-associated protein